MVTISMKEIEILNGQHTKNHSFENSKINGLAYRSRFIDVSRFEAITKIEEKAGTEETAKQGVHRRKRQEIQILRHSRTHSKKNLHKRFRRF
jgi:hypothetical protein